MAQAVVRSRFVWHELMTTDTKSAAAFFSKLIGWKTQVAPQDKSYTLFLDGSRQAAGLMALPEDAKAMGAPPSWLSYIGTPDVDKTARQAASLGGKVLRPPTDIPTVGRFAVLQDPQGAAFAAFTPASGGQAPAGDPGVGEYSWHELMTTDRAAAFSFYQNLFGWEATGTMEMGPQGTYQMFGLDGKAFGGMFKADPMPGPPMWLPYVRVADVTKAAATITSLGAKVINGPMTIPDGDMIVQALDAQGAMFALHSKPAAAGKAAPAKAKPAAQARTRAARPKKKAKAAKAKAPKAKAPKAKAKKAKAPKVKAKKKATRRKAKAAKPRARAKARGRTRRRR